MTGGRMSARAAMIEVKENRLNDRERFGLVPVKVVGEARRAE